MQRYLLVVFCLFAVAGCLRAGTEDKPKLNTLTAREIQDGWLLLFDGESTFGWDAAGWRAAGGVLASQEKNAMLSTTCRFLEFELEFEFLSTGKDAKLAFRKDTPDGAGIQLHGNFPGWQKAKISTKGRNATGSIYAVASKEKPSFPEAVIRERADVAVPLVFSGSKLRLRNVKLRPTGLTSIFNGKDLTGWKEHPGKKSKFSVTTEGWLNVKNGPGDLQTTGKWKDFVLQLECISNGKHLNSGIFFRCIPDVYQQGYEAQIHNGFLTDKLKTYTLQKFDPVTHKLVGKYEYQSPATDYGTGAIYNRQPVRKAMSKDFEWFGMTVVAQGRHMATWVNGVQVADWDDNRPLDDNARKGCCLNAGPLSIQGHDATTDLSFRNLRIVETK